MTIGLTAVLSPAGAGRSADVSREVVTSEPRRGEARQGALDAYGKLPLAFVPNAGQTHPRVRYSAQAGGVSFFFTRRAAVVALTRGKKGIALRLAFLGANPAPRVEGRRGGPGRVSYLIGNDPARWHTNLPTFGEIVYRDLWPGIDMVFRGADGRLKYEFRLRPGADPNAIRLAYQGARQVSLDRSGELLIATPLGMLTDTRPVSYQRDRGKRVAVSSRYSLTGKAGFAFALERYDRARPLVIDPGLAYSTYLGGTGLDEGLGIAVDSTAHAYVTGQTSSLDFPTTPGAFDASFNGSTDAFVTKLNPAGSALLYSTYLGGTSIEDGFGIAVDASDHAYVTGRTESANFPTTPGSFDTTYNGPFSFDGFVTKLNPTGSALLYSTYLGGTAYDEGAAIAIDSSGSAFVNGGTASPDFPTTADAFDTSFNGSTDAFVTKLNPAGSALVYSTYLGGSSLEGGSGIGISSTGDAFVTGQTISADLPTTPGAFDTGLNGQDDAFVTRLNPAGSALVYSTYLGGTGSDAGSAIAVSPAGNAYATGRTGSADFPSTPGAFDNSQNGSFDAYVTKLNPAGSALVYSTFLGGAASDIGYGIATDSAGNAHLTGQTTAPDFPTTPGAFDSAFNGNSDAFVTTLNPAGSALAYSTYLGGTAYEEAFGIVVDPDGDAYVVGRTFSADYPTTPGAFDTSLNGVSDAFVTKLDELGSPAVGPPTSLTLSPPGATNPTGTSHTVTAAVTNSAGQPAPGIIVRFSVTGAHMLTGSCTTGPNGQCTFSYTGAQAGIDAITAYADSDGDNVQELGEPTGAATKVWTPATPGCPPDGGDDDEDDDGLEDRDENLLGTPLGDDDSDDDGRRDGDDDSDDDGRDDEDEDDGTDDECPNDSDGDGEDDEDDEDEDDEDEDD